MRDLRLVLLSACVLGAFSSASCSTECEEPAYGGEGNDEVWLTLKDAKPNATVSEQSPSVESPTENQVFNASDGPPVFSWASPLKLSLGPGLPQKTLRAPHDSIGQMLARASAFLVPPARAHLPPVSSDAYLLDVLVPGRTCPVSVVTTELSAALDDESFEILKQAPGKDLSFQITSAYLQNGRISEGPFKAPDVTFRVE